MRTDTFGHTQATSDGSAMPNREVVYGMYNVYYRIDGRLIPTSEYPKVKK